MLFLAAVTYFSDNIKVVEDIEVQSEDIKLDRFIPNRSAMDMDYAKTMLSTKARENPASSYSPAREAYRKHLAETFNMTRTRILAFKDKPPTPVDAIPHEFHQVKPLRRIPQTPERKLDAPDLVDNYSLNLLDWGSSNVLSIALGSTVNLWDASNGKTSELVTVDEEMGPVTSVKWAPNGRLRTMKGGHSSRVGALDWKNDTILTTGGIDGQIINNDFRERSHIVYQGHHQEVCGLKWSASGSQLASGGNDNLLHIWDSRSSNLSTQYLHRMQDHTDAVKALVWYPFKGNLLATGGGEGDGTIKFWNTDTGACLNSIDTGSQVCALLWNKNECELLSSHGPSQNQLTLWKYPWMVKMAELTGHTRRVLFMAQSPDGCTVASAAGDETLQFWNVFGTPQAAKPAPKTVTEPYARLNRISLLFCLISNGFARDSFADGGSSFAAYFERRCWTSGGHVSLVAEDWRLMSRNWQC
ncbi:hypothetical protein RD792_013616 [Penstemon davidsonii]|uniref:CDC20/Fizzy WD40 domain-containing protein n=1 Tax=Penstemon davidsonii TaxID=160366 RepID=A0ABR0CUV6_9LAMI|nr:hypothetical protein RD792_013616 [Penstemon davidsonii]